MITTGVVDNGSIVAISDGYSDEKIATVANRFANDFQNRVTSKSCDWYNYSCDNDDQRR